VDAANRFRSRSCDLHLTHAVTLCHPQTPQEVHELLDRTKQEMQAATQAGGPSPKSFIRIDNFPTCERGLRICAKWYLFRSREMEEKRTI
jgi:hypothetical protein